MVSLRGSDGTCCHLHVTKDCYPSCRRYDLENSDTHKDKDAIDKLRKKFGAWHGLSSMLNLGALCAALAHAWWLAGRTGLAAAI